VTEALKRKHDFDMVHGAQEMFRLLLEALANPGRVLNFRHLAARFAGAGQWLAPAVTLLDRGTGFYWDGDPQTGEEIHFLSGAPRVSPEEADFVFVSGGGQDPGILSRVKGGTHRDPHDSALLFIAAGNLAPGVLRSETPTANAQRLRAQGIEAEIPQASQGEAEELERIARSRRTGVRRDAPPIHSDSGLNVNAGLRGPGIPPEGRHVELFPGEARWCRALEARGFEYPCGVELIFLREDVSLLALTRKTEFLWNAADARSGGEG
jgi:phosphonate C-P lyase system protein PhnH